jgi:uncharacterized Zn finger protein (UPF0148 family)
VLERATGSRYTDDDTVTLDVYDREGLPCRRCRTPIERAVQAGRSTYFCPSCQPRATATVTRTASKQATKKTAKQPAKKTAKKAAKKISKKPAKKSATRVSRSRRN